MSNQHDITAQLVGRHFVSKSGNICEVQRLGENAIRAFWKRKESDADRADFLDWMTAILGENLDITVAINKEVEKQLYEKWKKGEI